MSKRMGTLASIVVIAILLLSGFMVMGMNKVAADPASSVPDAPTALTATPGATRYPYLDRPSDNGGAAIDSYMVYVDRDR